MSATAPAAKSSAKSTVESAAKSAGTHHDAPLRGTALLIAGFTLALANFMVVLDTTIANVSVAHIAGSLAISASQGTWVITSYAVAEAICVPLTGWLAGRFGSVKTFAVGMAGFGIFSLLCGASTTLTMLVVCRIGQGLCGGPLMPLSQTLMLRIFPPERRGQAMGIWAMTTVVAPILGPILGGTLSDNWSWHWVFFINVPVAALCAFGAWRALGSRETPTERVRIDRVGLALMVVWIGALQILLDLGRERDWFSDGLIVSLGLIALVGFVVFLVWELTEDQPIVDLRVFRHRGFAASVASMAFAFGTFFATIVIVPQWLQLALGYTATDAGYVTAFTGVAALALSPIVGKLSNTADARLLTFFGIVWFGATSLLRVQWTSGADFWTLAMPQIVQGIGMPFFFIPISIIALGAVDPRETASAAGVMGFLRTMSAAIGTSLSISLWDDGTVAARSEIVSRLNAGPTSDSLQQSGFSLDQARAAIERIVQQESMTLASDHLFLASSLIFLVAAGLIWIAPRPKQMAGSVPAH
ncbi:DHA2 family efflux MFS transporter permease subunit [Novosphingobium lentum]|uniref:DHA2 family efflux MFS transporter permease subunit n=1 Tax=Novosphingobium lentum TaxID=145287 RepID=UPI0009FD2589|nr:DHA2 family efflux MFS transporter permease subunit [Novosphingobium lentum]